ncbi:alpha-parvin-like [Synchiropus splendidus]|uniref:alpha-parvin-like n=1 Tax=Synchiropus splendidus TaxID=270530 RepID=UPI00237E8223|nr:alpha-parvin-like [Synchiropus splendidus]
MASSPQKSPSSPKSPSSRKKDDSFLGKLGGTLARRKKAKEVSELQEEGINAINLPLSPSHYELDREDTMLEENEVRTMVDPNSRNDRKLQELMKVLIDWINDVLVGERIIVKDLAEDLYDGQVLQKLFEKLEGEKLNVAEVTQSEIAQKQKLQTVLERINDSLKLSTRNIRWNVDSVHAKSIVAILHLLVALSQHFRAPIRLPDHVSIQVVVVQKREGILQSRQIQEEITGNTEAFSGRHERDAFDTLFDHAPDKLSVVKKTLITFVNKHLNKLNLEVSELETQFADGVYLVLLMGLLEGYFVPLYNFFLTPENFDQKVRPRLWPAALLRVASRGHTGAPPGLWFHPHTGTLSGSGLQSPPPGCAARLWFRSRERCQAAEMSRRTAGSWAPAAAHSICNLLLHTRVFTLAQGEKLTVTGSLSGSRWPCALGGWS